MSEDDVDFAALVVSCFALLAAGGSAYFAYRANLIAKRSEWRAMIMAHIDAELRDAFEDRKIFIAICRAPAQVRQQQVAALRAVRERSIDRMQMLELIDGRAECLLQQRSSMNTRVWDHRFDTDHEEVPRPERNALGTAHDAEIRSYIAALKRYVRDALDKESGPG